MTKPKPKDDLFEAEAAAPLTPKPHPRPHVPHPTPKKPETKPRETKPVPRPDKPTRPPKATALVAAAPMNLLSLIGQAIINPAVDAAKLTSLVDWYDKREAKNAYDRDFLAMAPKLPVVERDGLIDQGITRSGRQGVKARYPRYESVHEAVAPIIHQFGFTFQTTKAIFGEKSVVIVRLNHYDARAGSYDEKSVEEIIRDDSGGKTGPQAYASGEQYAIRRAVIKLLHLRSKDPRDRDLDGNDPAKVAAAEAKAKEDAKPINAAQLKELRAKIEKATGLTEERVCEKYGVAKLEEFPMKVLPDAHKALDNWIAARSA